MPQLLTEYFSLPYDPKVIKEQMGSNKPIKLSGLLQKADEKNGNGRVYPFSVLKREVDKYKDIVKNHRAVGTLDHEDTPVITLEKVAHLIVDIGFDDSTGEVHGTLEVLNTPCGKIAQELLAGGVNIGISSRGVGSLIKEGDMDKVAEDYQLITFDLVSQGSVDGSWLTMKEHKEYQDFSLRYPSQQEVTRLLSKQERVKLILEEILQS